MNNDKIISMLNDLWNYRINWVTTKVTKHPKGVNIDAPWCKFGPDSIETLGICREDLAQYFTEQKDGIYTLNLLVQFYPDTWEKPGEVKITYSECEWCCELIGDVIYVDKPLEMIETDESELPF